MGATITRSGCQVSGLGGGYLTSLARSSLLLPRDERKLTVQIILLKPKPSQLRQVSDLGRDGACGRNETDMSIQHRI